MSATNGTTTLDPLAIIAASAPPLANTLGVLLICTAIGCMLFGLTVHQTFRYFRLYPTDSASLKIYVTSILGLDLTHTVLTIHICYFYLVSNYFFAPRLLEGVWSIRVVIAQTTLVIVLAHGFYARRMFLLGGGNIWPVLIIGVLVIAELGFGTTATIEAFSRPTFVAYQKYTWLLCSALGAAFAVDVFVTIAFIFYLRSSRTGFKRTDSMVDVLMMYAINTGLSTSIMSLVAAVTAITMPDNLIYCGVLIIASKLYANSVLAVLNSRRSLMDKGLDQIDTGSFGMKVADPREPNGHERGYSRSTSRVRRSHMPARPPPPPRSPGPQQYPLTSFTDTKTSAKTSGADDEMWVARPMSDLNAI